MQTGHKQPVALRAKTLKGGGKSLYLDTYINGTRKYEFLKLYLVPEKTRDDRERNRETLRLANAVRAKRTVDIQEGRFGFSPAADTRTGLVEFLDTLLPGYGGGTLKSWRTLRMHLTGFADGSAMLLSSVDAAVVERFTGYLLNEAGLARSSADLMLSKLRRLFAVAVKRGLVGASPFADVPRLMVEEKERGYLVLDEVRRLAAAPCARPVVKRAFLFGCLTGLRLSDITGLVWRDVRGDGRIVFRQRKTGGQEYLDITPQARELMGARGEPGEPVFKGLTVALVRRHLGVWMEAAGIDRHITFHCSRHTFAVMMLDLGTDIYTVSKLLGHRSLETTQVYAHILDKNKQKAVMGIPQIL